MASFDIIVTVDVTHSASVTVKARSADDAREKALKLASEGKLTFTFDDGNDYDDFYITGCERGA